MPLTQQDTVRMLRAQLSILKFYAATTDPKYCAATIVEIKAIVVALREYEHA